MVTLILCRVIDNYGDAGFALRLALALAKQGKLVHLLCDNIATLNRLTPPHPPSSLQTFSIDNQALLNDYLNNHSRSVHAVLECFGSSNVPDSPISNTCIRNAIGQKSWLVIDYLSAEAWIESLHGLPSIEPSSGYQSQYFYPGFSERSGGIIHSDLPGITDRFPSSLTKVLVFSYPSAPVEALQNALSPGQEIGLAGGNMNLKGIKKLPFRPIDEFDALLAEHDFLFVRGEDSFVRAQLSGRPFVWQIYPTEDLAHAEKLIAFYKIYSQGMDQETSSALWDIWLAWNSLGPGHELPRNWAYLTGRYQQLIKHASHWKARLTAGPELVKEVLTHLGD